MKLMSYASHNNNRVSQIAVTLNRVTAICLLRWIKQSPVFKTKPKTNQTRESG
jgi:hypothetical protein